MPFLFSARAPAVACAAALIVAFATNTAAGDPLSPSDASLVALRSAVREAWARHPAAEATEQTLVAAEARTVASSRPLYNPDLELAYDDEGSEQTTTAGIALTLDLSGKRRARSDAGQADLVLAEAEAALRRSGFAQQWLQAWTEHGSARERVRIGEERLALMQRFADLAERQLTVGDISSLERDLALLARDEAQAEQATLLADAASATEAYRAVGGDPSLRTDIAALGVPAAWTGDPSWQVAATPEGRIVAATAASAATRIAIAERDRRPDPTLSLYGGRKDLGTGSETEGVVGLAVSVPLFVRNNLSAELAAARADASAATAEQRRAALELRARAERAAGTFTAVRDAWTRWSQSSGTDVTTRADLLERLWRAGEISTADYLIQLKQSLDTALAGAGLRGRLWRSYVDALYSTGQLDAWVGFDRPVSEVTP
ncbi:MAG: TolC family protein [Steroidobacteraceae bacterium]|nr:TolC family protein [Steroidobacteraceae bacterium]MBP7015062.1 TolC family protein [Steroidobacteraceae bacterium]